MQAAYVGRVPGYGSMIYRHGGVLLEVAAVSVLYCMCTLKLNVEVKVKVVQSA